MPPQRRDLTQALQDKAGAGEAGGSVPSPAARKRPRYGYHAVVSTPSASLATDKEAEVTPQRDNVADLLVGDVQPQVIENQVAEHTPEGLDQYWRPTFGYQDCYLKEDDSIWRSPSVAASIMDGITKADDVSELKDVAPTQLRNDALQDMLKAAQRFIVLDDRRVMLSRTQSDALKKLEEEKKIFAGQLKSKKKELDTSNGLLSGLNQQLNSAQVEKSTLRSDNDRIRLDNERLMKELADLQAKMKDELDGAEQKGYDLCFEENLASIRSVRGRLYQVGYDFGLDTAQVPPVSDLRVPVSVPVNFQYVVEVPMVEAAASGEEVEEQVPADGAVVAEDGREEGGGRATAAVEGDLEDTCIHDPAIPVD